MSLVDNQTEEEMPGGCGITRQFLNIFGLTNDHNHFFHSAKTGESVLLSHFGVKYLFHLGSAHICTQSAQT